MKSSNRTIVITGASKGLGREIALRLCRKNENLILVARTENTLKKIQLEIERLTSKTPWVIPCNVSNEKDVNHLAEIIREKFKWVDVLINNAGIGIPKRAETITSAEMRKQFEVNFFGAFYCTRALLPVLRLSPAGYILNIGSLLGEMSLAATSTYSATKFALSGFSEGLHYEMKRSNVKIGILLPGPMATSFHDNESGDLPRVPGWIMLDPAKVAKTVEKMVRRRKRKVYLHRWILWLMKIRRLFG